MAMVKVPQRLSNGQSAPPQGRDLASSADARRDIARELSVTSINADRRGISGHADGAVDEGVELDAAIDAVLAASDVDPVTRAHLDDARGAIGTAAQHQELRGFQGENLAEALFRFVMPRLRHPDVLHAERRRATLELLSQDLDRVPADRILGEGATAIHRELQGLAMLRQGRNSLIEG
ncbi:hypothetical protein I3J27_13430 [Bradyrhizobium xenonodulans]|uniref:Uncharacterized protein n=1 Tax=Bradyrhizobium xenonodulans TaxID=2736875 RepID=A0ABY7MWP2_9BRAD|nr:hypothetical protein [Bradyrhizobium xenonodulans]WBL81370.1 hypothetical protein I3J27_13430 [Bradyrhizobium xenonodulans]